MGGTGDPLEFSGKVPPTPEYLIFHCSGPPRISDPLEPPKILLKMFGNIDSLFPLRPKTIFNRAEFGSEPLGQSPYPPLRKIQNRNEKRETGKEKGKP